MTIRSFSISRYIETALFLARYETDENGMVVAEVPNVPGYFSEGSSVEEARRELADAIEGNLLLALQLQRPIPELPGFHIEEQVA
jgi:predicted RNase H-like HicB family nuclease